MSATTSEHRRAASGPRGAAGSGSERGSGGPSGAKRQRQEAILRVVKDRRIPHQEALREVLASNGHPVTQPTLSRDIRDLRLVKVIAGDGGAYYTVPEELDNVPPLDAVLPTLFVSAEAVGNLVIVRTLSGGAHAVASGIDWEEYEGLAGSIAGDDTALLILRSASSADTVARALERIALRQGG